MSDLTRAECDAGISRNALDTYLGKDKPRERTNGSALPVLDYRARFMCMRVAYGVNGDAEITLDPQWQTTWRGHGPKPVISASRISIVIVGEDRSPVKFEPGKSYFLHFSEADTPAVMPAPAVQRKRHA